MVLRTVKDFFRSRTCPRTPRIWVLARRAPIRHSDEGGGGSAAGEARVSWPGGAGAATGDRGARREAAPRRVGAAASASTRGAARPRGSHPGGRPRNHCGRSAARHSDPASAAPDPTVVSFFSRSFSSFFLYEQEYTL